MTAGSRRHDPELKKVTIDFLFIPLFLPLRIGPSEFNLMFKSTVTDSWA